MIADQQSPQYYDDLIFSSNKKDQENRIQQYSLELTAQKLKKQLEKNKEFNQSYMAQLHGFRSNSETKNIESNEEYISQPYALSDDEQQQEKSQNNEDKKYFLALVNKYAKKQKPRQRECCQPKQLDLPRQQKNAKYMEYSKEEVWQRLLEDKRQAIEQREQEKRKQLEEIVQQECPFVPQISDLAARTQTDEPVVERLYKDGIDQKRRKEQMRIDHFNQEQYPFKPEVSSQIKSVLKGEAMFQKPLYERIDDVIKRKQEQLLYKQQEQFKQQEATFQPKISQKSIQIAEQKLVQKSVIDRLMEDATIKMQRKVQQQPDLKGSEQCTFNPEIIPTNPIEGDVQQVNQVFQAQYLMADFMREKKQKLMEEFMKNSNYQFKPTLNRQSELIIESNEERLLENPEDKFKRLGQQDFEKNRMLKQQLNQDYYQQFTFKPEINQISKMIARKRSLDNLAYNPEREQKLRQLKEEQMSKETYSFYPSTYKTDKYQYVKSKYDKKNIKSNMEIEKEMKERKYQDLKKQVEYEQLKDCTFKPILTNYKKDDMSIEEKVRGLDKFMLNKENLKRQQFEKEERVRDVFNYAEKYDFQKHLNETKPEPFNITQKNQNLMRQLQIEAIEREKEICTFHPKINKIEYI